MDGHGSDIMCKARLKCDKVLHPPVDTDMTGQHFA